MIKFAVRVGLASAAVYYINEQGLWKSSDDSIKTYNQLRKTLHPYVKELESHIPYELPELPQSDSITTLAKTSWNLGVLASCQFLSNLPETMYEWTCSGVEAVTSNPKFEKLIESFSNTTTENK